MVSLSSKLKKASAVCLAAGIFLSGVGGYFSRVTSLAESPVTEASETGSDGTSGDASDSSEYPDAEINKDEEYYRPVLNTIDSSQCSYILLDTQKSQVLLKKDETAETDASLLARLMTCLIAIQNLALTDKITAMETMPDESGFTIVAGTSYTVNTLLESVILGGCSNAAQLLSENVTLGTSFTEHMNELADQYGMYDTYFTNVDGSESALQKTTVYDTAVFLSKALQNSRFKSIFCSPAAINSDGIIIKNTNPIVISNTSDTLGGAVYKIPGFDDKVTTAYFCDSNIADQSANTSIILITAGLPESFIVNGQDALLFRFENTIKKVKYINAGSVINTVKVGEGTLRICAKSSVYFYMPADEEDYIDSISYIYAEGCSPSELSVPISANTNLGTAGIRLKDGTLIEVSIYTGNSILSKKAAINRFLSFVTQYYDMILLIGGLSLIIILLILAKIVFHVIITVRR